MKTRAKSVRVKWQESNFCQYMFMTKANLFNRMLIYAVRSLPLVNRNQFSTNWVKDCYSLETKMAMEDDDRNHKAR